jgi:uncharacterized protein YcbK (DUF882 family)
MWKWKYFQPKEVLSPVGLYQYERGNLMVQAFALDAFDQLREEVGSRLVANGAGLKFRGYRSPVENKSIGGAELSRHCQGIALDVTPLDIQLYDFYQHVLSLANELGLGGIGYYPSKGFVHIDCRPLMTDGPITWIEE